MIPTAPYTEEGQDAWRCFGADVPLALEAVARRYVGENPVRPPAWRLAHEGGPRRGWDGRYRFAFGDAPPLAAGDLAVAVSSLYRDNAGPLSLSLSADGPVTVSVGGQAVFALDPNPDGTTNSQTFEANLCRGWNPVVLVFHKTPTGFGGAFGAISPYRELRFLVPSRERAGEEGWIWTFVRRRSDDEVEVDVEGNLPGYGFCEETSGRLWFPPDRWSADQVARGLFGRLPGAQGGLAAQVRSVFELPSTATRRLGFRFQGDLTIWWDGECVFEGRGGGRGQIEVHAARGPHEVAVESVAPDDGPWDFDWDDLQDVVRRSPVPVQGRGTDALVLGPYPAAQAGAPLGWSFEIPSPLAQGPGFWRADRPGRVVHPGWEAPLFGQWNYPLGVTLYGLLSLGRGGGPRDLVDYVRRHVAGATAYFALATWEYATYGATNLNRQMVVLDLLDNCGSFGSLMLELAKTEPVPHVEAIAARIQKFIETDHERVDGCLYRAHHHVPQVVGTLWADDLYMSVPFLVRCAVATEAPGLLVDAAHQLLRFADKLAIPGTELLSHVYDVNQSVGTLVPWGRGNGWFLFSLVELLSELPEDHPDRPELLDLLVRKAEGYRRVQTADGWWHQVLDDPTSYAETSCTAMFAYAFTRGVSRGWLAEVPFGPAAEAGLRAILSGAVDARGNVYGVCKGSGFSFTRSYYRDDLEWVLNDTHGVGIVLLAGVEVLNLVQGVEPRH